MHSGGGSTTWQWLQSQCLGAKASGIVWVFSRAAVCGLIYMRWSIFKILKQLKKIFVETLAYLTNKVLLTCQPQWLVNITTICQGSPCARHWHPGVGRFGPPRYEVRIIIIVIFLFYRWVNRGTNILTSILGLSVQFSPVAQSCPTLRPHELQYSRPPCPSPTPRVYSNSCPLSRWCHWAISSSVIPFSSCPQSLPSSESFPMSQLFARGGQSTGVSALASVLPMNTQDWSPLEWTSWISLQSKGLSSLLQHHSSKASILQGQPSSCPTLTSIHDHWKNHSLD